MSRTQSLDELRATVLQMLETLDAASQVGSAVVYRVNRTSEDTFESDAQTLRDASKKLPGCRVFNLNKHKSIYSDQPAGDSTRYLVYEEWDTPALFRAQWESDHLKTFQQAVMYHLSAPPDHEFYTQPAARATESPLSKTGQTKCWAVNGDEKDCKGTGQDGEYQRGSEAPEPRFIDNKDGTVTDQQTGLIWLKDADAFGTVSWEQALKYARGLASGNCGLSDSSSAGDWRLSNIRELLSIIDYGESSPIIPHPHPFINVRTTLYWTSTTLAPAPILAWMMTLGIGPTVFDVKHSPSNRMWPVRGQARIPKSGQKQCWDLDGKPISCNGTGQDGELQAGLQPPSPRFTDNNDGTVTDNLTGLVWLKNANPFGLRMWEEALQLCNNLSTGSYGLSDGSVIGDWRLPNIREAESLVDYNNFGPCLPTGHPFATLRPSSYWTSTSVTASPTEAMFIIYGVGPSIFENKEHAFFVWPVRDKLPRR